MQGFGTIMDGTTGESFQAVYRISRSQDLPGATWMGTFAILRRGVKFCEGVHRLRLRDGRELEVSVWHVAGTRGEFAVSESTILGESALRRTLDDGALDRIAWPAQF